MTRGVKLLKCCLFLGCVIVQTIDGIPRFFCETAIKSITVKMHSSFFYYLFQNVLFGGVVNHNCPK